MAKKTKTNRRVAAARKASKSKRSDVQRRIDLLFDNLHELETELQTEIRETRSRLANFINRLDDIEARLPAKGEDGEIEMTDTPEQADRDRDHA